MILINQLGEVAVPLFRERDTDRQREREGGREGVGGETEGMKTERKEYAGWGGRERREGWGRGGEVPTRFPVVYTPRHIIVIDRKILKCHICLISRETRTRH